MAGKKARFSDSSKQGSSSNTSSGGSGPPGDPPKGGGGPNAPPDRNTDVSDERTEDEENPASAMMDSLIRYHGPAPDNPFFESRPTTNEDISSALHQGIEYIIYHGEGATDDYIRGLAELWRPAFNDGPDVLVLSPGSVLQPLFILCCMHVHIVANHVPDVSSIGGR